MFFSTLSNVSVACVLQKRICFSCAGITVMMNETICFVIFVSEAGVSFTVKEMEIFFH